MIGYAKDFPMHLQKTVKIAEQCIENFNSKLQCATIYSSENENVQAPMNILKSLFGKNKQEILKFKDEIKDRTITNWIHQANGLFPIFFDCADFISAAL
jgi:hypothetical protein